MKVIVDLCVVPIGVGVHLAPYIAACEKVLTEAGLKIQLHPNGTARFESAVYSILWRQCSSWERRHLN